MPKQSSDISFALVKVTTEQFAILDDHVNSNNDDIRLSVSFRFSASEAQSIIGTFCMISFENKGNKFIVVEVGCHFSLKKESWNLLTEESGHQLVIPCDIARHFAMLTTGTCRGVLHSKTEGSSFNQFILPTINISTILKEDVILNDFDK